MRGWGGREGGRNPVGPVILENLDEYNNDPSNGVYKIGGFTYQGGSGCSIGML